MSSNLAERPARKGTKSCAECRRRKLRCDWESLDARTCRRCSERGTTCVAQTFYVKPSDPHKLSSKQRIQLLENKVASLVKAVNTDTRTSPGSSSAHDTPHTQTSGLSAAGDDGSDGDGDLSSDSDSDDAVPENKPGHLNALFENDWLSIDANQDEGQTQKPSTKSTNRRLASASLELGKLIPSREDVITILDLGVDMPGLEFMEFNFPEPWVLTTKEELLNYYDTVSSSTSDAYAKAFWLSALSKLSQQVISEPGTPSMGILGGSRNLVDLPKLVGKTIESKILRHDKLLGCTEGLGLAMECVRLHLYHGNFQKSWLLLKRAISVAELLGYPQISRMVQLDTVTIATKAIIREDPKLAKGLLWEALLDLDKICSTMLNLPSGSIRHETPRQRPLIVNGEVRDRAYLSRLADLSVQTRYIDNWALCTKSKVAMYPTILDLDRQLRELTLQVPASWWAAPVSAVDPRHIIHYWQGYVAMRIHLPYTLERDPEPMYMYSQLAGIDACKTLLTRYNILRTNLPAAFFLGRLLDIQAFAASVVLLLTSQKKHGAAYADTKSIDETIEVIIPRTVALMEEKCRDISGATNFGKVGANTIRALSTLLSASPDDASAQQELTLKVPLLGKINVRKRQPESASPSERQPQMCAPEPGGSELPLVPENYQHQPDPGPPVDASLINALSVRDWQPQYEPFSWSVVQNYEDPFQDALMSDAGFGDWYNATV